MDYKVCKGVYHQLRMAVLSVVIAGCSGCSLLLEPPPISDTPYLADVPAKLTADDPRVPFQRSWADHEAVAEFVGVPGVIIKRVTVTADLLEPSSRKRRRKFEQIQGDADALALLFEQNIRLALLNFPERTAILKENAQVSDRTLIIEVAIVELVPQAVSRKILSTGFGLFNVLGSLFGLYGDSVIAIEGKLIRARDNKLIAAIADRHAGKFAPVDFRIISQYHQAEENIREWSDDIAELINSPLSHKVRGESVITLLPW